MTTKEKIRSLLMEFFNNDEAKVNYWMRMPNPLLGALSPEYMISIGREEKLLRFIECCLEENKNPSDAKS